MSEFKPEIHQRDIHFGMDADIPVHWHGGDAHRTRFLDALSLFFPEGERFFIESVRHYRDKVKFDDALNQDVRAFIGQEAMHGREHNAYNARLEQQGIPAKAMEAGIKKRLDLARKLLPKRNQLAITVCLEHFTAIMAHEVIANERNMAAADPRMARLWRWHAVEETEHKAVAFDVYQRVIPNAFLRYVLRCLTMLQISIAFNVFVWVYFLRLLKHDGKLGDLRGWAGWFKFMFGQPGPLRKILPAWLDWFKPGFHPWDHDNRQQLEAARVDYETPVLAA